MRTRTTIRHPERSAKRAVETKAGAKRNNRTRTKTPFRGGFLRCVRTVVLASVEMTLQPARAYALVRLVVYEAVAKRRSPGEENGCFIYEYPKPSSAQDSAPYTIVISSEVEKSRGSEYERSGMLYLIRKGGKMKSACAGLQVKRRTPTPRSTESKFGHRRLARRGSLLYVGIFKNFV